MWLKDLFQRLLSMGADPDSSDDDRMVKAAVVRPFQAPMLVQVLDQNDIEYEVHEELNHGTWETMTAIMVKRVDSKRAVEVLEDFRYS